MLCAGFVVVRVGLNTLDFVQDAEPVLGHILAMHVEGDIRWMKKLKTS
jgi:hypothetical protein